MDLISTLIKSKKQSEIPLEDYFKELIKYVKLAKNQKFKHIKDSPLLQKQMPLCWKAFNNDPIAYYQVLSIAGIVQNTSNQELPILADLLEIYGQKKQRQYQIIGKSNGFMFVYHDILQLDYRLLDNHDMLYLIEPLSDNELRMSAVQQVGKNINVYTGNIKLNPSEQKPNPRIKPYRTMIKNEVIEISSYSRQGNNDYEFGQTNRYFVKMPNNHSLSYRDKQTNQIITVELDDADVQTFSLHKSIEYLSVLISEYEPKGDK